MNSLIYNKGAEHWYAHYYNTSTSSFSEDDIDTINEFGATLANGLNEYLNELCDEIKFLLNNRLLDANRTKACFNPSEKVFYNSEERYLRFPDFIIPELKDFVLRLDINPCIGREKATTKVYCIHRVKHGLTRSEAKDFYLNTDGVCKQIIRIVMNKYKDLFNAFIDARRIKNVAKLNDEELLSPSVMVYRVLGSDDVDTKKFIKKANKDFHDGSEFSEFNSTNNRAKDIIAAMKELIEIDDPAWKTKDYTWYTPSKSIMHGSSIDSRTEEVNGYLGLKKEGDTTFHFVGITDSTPRDLLLPLNIQTINRN